MLQRKGINGIHEDKAAFNGGMRKGGDCYAMLCDAVQCRDVCSMYVHFTAYMQSARTELSVHTEWIGGITTTITNRLNQAKQTSNSQSLSDG